MHAALSALLLFALPLTASAQDPVTIELGFEKKLGAKGHGFVAMYEYQHDALVSYEGERRKIVAPRLAEDSKVAYGFIYFVGRPKGALADGALFMVENYTSAEARFFVDLNNNLDLTDDRGGWEREPETQNHMITLRAAAKPHGTYTVRLGFFRDDPVIAKHPEILAEYRTLLSGYTARMGGTPVATKHWFWDQALNVRSASVRVGEWDVQIGVLDENCDGNYSEAGQDLVLVGAFGGEFLPRSRSAGATELAAETLIKIGPQTYEVLEVDPAGAFVRIVASDKAYTRLVEGAQLPDLELTMLDGGRTSMADWVDPEGFLLIDFWGHWCKGCLLALPELKRAAEEFEGALTILSLHNGDHDQGRAIVEREELDWPQAVASDDIIEAFRVDAWPRYVLVSGDGRIMSMNIDLQAVTRILRDRNEESQ